METQCEVNNSSKETLLSKLNSLSFSIARNWLLYSLQNGTEGLIRNISSMWKAKDQRSHVVTWKPEILFYFLAQIPMYVGCSRAAYLYACCIVCKMRTSGKKLYFCLWILSTRKISLHREME
jgi:uncharacterized BrkB/YihY/UPF0761 family membrane protein